MEKHIDNCKLPWNYRVKKKGVVLGLVENLLE